MELSAPLFGDFSLTITDRPASGDTREGGYPAARLQGVSCSSAPPAT